MRHPNNFHSIRLSQGRREWLYGYILCTWIARAEGWSNSTTDSSDGADHAGRCLSFVSALMVLSFESHSILTHAMDGSFKNGVLEQIRSPLMNVGIRRRFPTSEIPDATCLCTCIDSISLLIWILDLQDYTPPQGPRVGRGDRSSWHLSVWRVQATFACTSN